MTSIDFDSRLSTWERERDRMRANSSRQYTQVISSLSLSDVAAAEEFLHSFSLVLDSNSSTFMFRSFVLWFSIRKFGHLSFSFCVYTFLWVLFQPGQRLVFFLKRGKKVIIIIANFFSRSILLVLYIFFILFLFFCLDVDVFLCCPTSCACVDHFHGVNAELVQRIWNAAAQLISIQAAVLAARCSVLLLLWITHE